MDKISLLLNAQTETEFFILFYSLIKEPGDRLSLELDSVQHNGEFAIQITRKQGVVRMEGASRNIREETTHVFTLTQSGILTWQMLGEEKPIVGLANIQARLRDMQEQHSSGEQSLSAQHSPQSQVSEHRTLPLQL